MNVGTGFKPDLHDNKEFLRGDVSPYHHLGETPM
jgi:hypothetical protein